LYPAEGEIEMKKLEKIMKMLTEAGYEKNCKMSNQPDRNGKHGLYINCRNSQYVTENDDGTIQMQAVGGSRYSYPHIKTAEECAEVMIEQCGKTTGDINKEYRALWDEINKQVHEEPGRRSPAERREMKMKRLYTFANDSTKEMTKEDRKAQFEREIREEYDEGWENGWIEINDKEWHILVDGE